MKTEHLPNQKTQVLGLRYRSFSPWSGLHPSMPAERAVVLTLRHASGAALQVTLHPWRPDGKPYSGLPRDLEEAARRQEERVVVEQLPSAQLPPSREPPVAATTPYCLDLRRLEAREGP